MTISKKKTAFWLQCALAVCNVVLYYKAAWTDVLSYEGDVAPFIVIIIPLVCIIGAAIEAGLLIISRRLTTREKPVINRVLFWLLFICITVLAGIYLRDSIPTGNWYDVGFAAGCWAFLAIFLSMMW